MEEGWTQTLLLLLGGLTFLYWSLSVLWTSAHLIRCYVWARLVKGEPWTKRFGQWAVVTGASDGIGKAYVHKLAERGMNVVLIARNKDKLDTVAQTVRSSYGVETSVVVADFSDGQSIYDHIAKELDSKDIGVLVNNVGVSGPSMCLFSEWDNKSIWDIVNVNVGSVPSMTKIVLPGMLQRHRGIIINNGSLFSVMPMPRTATYAATKAFVDFFTQALSVELEGTGVSVQGLHPGMVNTNMSKDIEHTDMGKTPSFLYPTASVYVESALPTIGHTDYTHGYWGHSLHRAIFDIMKALPFKLGSKSILKESLKTREQMLKAL